MKTRSRVGLLITFAVAAGVFVGCANTADDCRKIGTCPVASGTGGVTSGGETASNGGDAPVTANGGGSTSPVAGGTTNTTAGNGSSNAPSGGTGTTSAAVGGNTSTIGGASSSAGVAGSTTVPKKCDGSCAEPTPYCNTASNTCVACLTNAHCADIDASTPVCSASNTCVECQTSADCTDPNASLCNPADQRCERCSVDEDCTHIDGKHVCYAGSCVQCSGKNYQSCGKLEGAPLVCDSLKRECSKDKTEKSTGLCQECVSDAQCLPGQFCLPQYYNNVLRGNYCFWRKGDTASGAPTTCLSDEGRPYVNAMNLTSMDGTTGTFCTLAVSNCVAMNQFRNKDCLFNGAPDNVACGLIPGKDSKCAESTKERGTFFCTVACDSDLDCMPGYACLPGGSIKFCALDKS